MCEYVKIREEYNSSIISQIRSKLYWSNNVTEQQKRNEIIILGNRHFLAYLCHLVI